jgi:hypothetical protein
METNKKNKKRWFALATLFILIVGGVMVAYAANSYAASTANGNWNEKGKGGLMSGGFGVHSGNRTLSENASKKVIREEFMNNSIDELGLPENATFKDITEAMKSKMNETRAAIDDAIADNDYVTWKNLVNNTPQGNMLLEKITEDNFDEYAQMQEYLKKAAEIGEDLGLQEQGGKGGMGFRGRGGPRGGEPNKK